MGYGKELILDLHDCDPTTYDNREKIEAFVENLCDLIEVEPAALHFWDYAGRPTEYDAADDRWKGSSAVQFILTSNITIHTLDALRCVYLNVFSCDTFKVDVVVNHALKTFGGHVAQQLEADRL